MRIHFEPIIPPRPKRSEFDREMLRGIRELRQTAYAYYASTIATWDRKPKIHRKTTWTAGQMDFQVWIEDDIYAYLDEGVGGHLIFPRNRKKLAFKSEYRAKTVPGMVGSRQGGSSGKTVVVKYTNWPGITPRDFEITIAREMDKELTLIQFYIDAGAVASGYT